MRGLFVVSICSALVYSQSFPDGFSYDFDIPTLSDKCQAALNETVQCSWMLPLNDLEGLQLTSDNLTTICTSDCGSSLKSVAASIRSACPVSANQIVVGNIAYPASETIDRLSDLYRKVCLKDQSTGDFCYSVMDMWQDQDDLTEEQSCSDCLLGTLSLDQSSGFSYNAAFESNFSAMTARCGKTGYEPTKPTPIALNSSTEATTMPTPSCASTYTVRAEDTCGGICKANNVSTFALAQANELDAYCQSVLSTGTELCLPNSCDIYTVQHNDTCRTVAGKHPSYITITQLQAWNPNLNGLCTNMEQQVDTQICVGPPGNTLMAPSNTAAQPSAPTTTAGTPEFVANGTNTRCAKYYKVAAGDTCGDITIRNGISLSDFYFLNKGINSECANLFAEESYCILPVGNIATYSGYGGYEAMECTGAGSPSTCYGDYARLSPTPFQGQAAQATKSGSSSQSSPTTCSIKFVVNRQTSFGSSVRIVGSIGQLGTWDAASSLGMGSESYTTSNPVWDFTLTLPCGTSGEYKYILDSDGTKTWETTGNRNFVTNDASITVQDSWESSGSTTVTNTVSTTPRLTSSARPATIATSSTVQASATACSITFIVDKVAQNGETVRVVGSDAQLGAWDPSSSVELSGEQYTKAVPMWYITMDLPFDTAQYKYLSVSDGTTSWESTPNRNIDGDACKANGGTLVLLDTWEDSSTTASSTMSTASPTSTASPSSTSSAKPTATACRATFIVERETQFGESISLVGSAAQLGTWDAASAVALDASDYTTDSPVWSTTLTLPFGSTQYKYVLQSGGTSTWEADPNRDFDGDKCKSNGGSLTVRNIWQSAAGAGSTASRPSPTQEGLASDCSDFYFVKSGDGCYDIAASHGISLNDFYKYNPAVGFDCSKLYPDYYVCVGI